jgi:hypothetical protein
MVPPKGCGGHEAKNARGACGAAQGGVAGGQWEPGSRRWHIERRRLGPLVRALRRDPDPLFRHAGIDLDGR